jgi:hypothetical protein
MRTRAGHGPTRLFHGTQVARFEEDAQVRGDPPRSKVLLGPGGAMSSSRQKVDDIRKACPHRNCLPRIGASEVDLRGPRPRSPPRTRLRTSSSNPRRSGRRLRSRRKRPSRSSMPPLCPWKTPLVRVAPPPDAPTESGRAKQTAAQIACKRRTRAHCTAASVICRYIRIHCLNGYTYSCTRCGILRVWAYLKRKCRRGLLRGGSGSALFERVVKDLTFISGTCHAHCSLTRRSITWHGPTHNLSWRNCRRLPNNRDIGS